LPRDSDLAQVFRFRQDLGELFPANPPGFAVESNLAQP
jgi:hypothetical protein